MKYTLTLGLLGHHIVHIICKTLETRYYILDATYYILHLYYISYYILHTAYYIYTAYHATY